MTDDNNTPLQEFSFEVPATVADAAASIMAQEPEVQEHAIQQSNTPANSEPIAPSPQPSVAQPAASASGGNAGKTDSAGTVFDERIHTGSILKNGTWRLKKSAKGASTSVVGKPGGNTGAVAPQAELEAKAKATAVTTNMLIEHTCRGLIDPNEWTQSDAERVFQIETWTAYYVAKGVVDLPPGLMVCVALLSYAAPRLRQEQTAKKVGRIKTWIAVRYGAWKLRRELKKRGVNATVVVKDNRILVDGKPVE